MVLSDMKVLPLIFNQHVKQRNVVEISRDKIDPPPHPTLLFACFLLCFYIHTRFCPCLVLLFYYETNLTNLTKTFAIEEKNNWKCQPHFKNDTQGK